MRAATIFNFLLEANLMAGAAILLMIVFRKFLRKPLGNRLVYCLWLLIAIRLLCPLALSTPIMNAFRPYYLDDQVIRPIAGQIKIRLTDAIDDLRRLTRGDRDSVIYQSAQSFVNGMYYGTLSKLLMRIYLWGAGAVLLIFAAANIRFRRKLKLNRIEQISGKLKEQYLAVCRERKVKPIPVWFTDPLPSACLVGVVRPYIALPLTAAPQEAIHVLTHEICHYKGRDHWFNVLRLLCCAVHWFNPLVWAAALMSRTDAELACDARVVSKLSPDDRIHYTNTLVLAASKRYAPGVGVLATGMTMTGRKLQSRVRSILNFEQTVKWLMVTTAILAVMALTAAFFTAEYRIYPDMPQVIENSDLLAVQSLETEEEARQFAQTFFTQSSLALDLAGAEWMISETDTMYDVQIYRDPDESPVTMSLLKDGTITHFFIPSNYDRAGAASTLYEGEYEKQAEVAEYIMSFWEANQPSVSYSIDLLHFAGEGAFGEEWFVSFYGTNEISETSYWFTVQVLPQVQMVSYNMNTPMMLSLLDDTEIETGTAAPTAVPDAQINGYWAFDITSENGFFSTPTADAMAIEDALEIGVQAIMEAYGENNMERFHVMYGFVAEDTAGDTFRRPYWQFQFRNESVPSDYYDVVVHAIDGEILYLANPDEGNG